MKSFSRIPLAVLALATASPVLHAADEASLTQLREEINTMRRDYESRLKALEAQVKEAQAALSRQPVTPETAGSSAAAATPATAMAAAPEAPRAAAPPSSASAFNPAIGLVLSGTYANLSKDPSGYRIPGLWTGGEIGPGAQGFSLGESELSLSGGIDPWFNGKLTMAVSADNSVEIEEAYVQTSALPAGLSLRAGRYLAAIGYLNDKHAHTWNFIGAPLAYQAFLGGQLGQDGLQLRTVLPTDTFIELGGGIGNAELFSNEGTNRKKPGTATLFAHTGGDVGASNSWRAGLSMLWGKSTDQTSETAGAGDSLVTSAFSGNTRVAIIDGVWKWAPNGNAKQSNLTLQGEYLWRKMSGSLVYDSTNTAVDDLYRANQGGWYAQAVYQFSPQWRVGLRYDQLNLGNVDAYSNASNLYLPAYSPKRATLMFDWSPSEFSRVRLQFASDKSRYGLTDNQFMIQYQMSLGAHGAHSY